MRSRSTPVLIAIAAAAASAAASPMDDAARTAIVEALETAERQGHLEADPARSYATAEQAVQDARRLGDPALLARALVTLAGAAQGRGEAPQALALAREAERVAREAGAAGEEAWAIDMVGNALFFLQRHDEALASFEASRRKMQALGDAWGLAVTTRDVGVAQRLLGRHDRSLHELGEAVDRFREAGDPSGTASALVNLGSTYETLGAAGLAAAAYEEAAHESEGAGNVEVGVDLHTRVGYLYLSADRPRRALGAFREALALLGERDVAVARQWAETGMALAHLRLGERADARVLAEAVLQRAERADAWMADALQLAARVELETDPAAAKALAEEALARLAAVGSRKTWWAHALVGRAELRLGRSAAAAGAYRQALSAVDATDPGDPDDGTRTAPVEPLQPLFREAALAILQAGGASATVQESFDIVERARFSSRRADIVRGSADDQAAVARLRRAAARRRDRTRLLSELARLPPRAEVGPRPTLEELRRQLGSDVVLVSYVLSSTQAVAFVLRPDGLLARTLPATPEILERRVQSYLDLSRRGDGALAEPVAWQLHEELVAPLRAELAAAKQVVIVPDGVLWSLPFEALAEGAGKPRLVETHAVSYAPSAASLVDLAAPTGGPSGRLLLVAQPGPSVPSRETAMRAVLEDEGFDIAALPAAAREAAAIAALAPSGSLTLTAAGATEAAVRRLPLHEFRILHVAAHGLASERSPDLSALVLAAGDGEDGLLQAREVASLSLQADLVVLSACRTARGRILAGRGVVGLTSAFLDAGARTVIASLADVDDASTAELMESLYGHLASGRPKSEALRAAKLDLAARGFPPSAWAPFVLVGDPFGRVPLGSTTGVLHLLAPVLIAAVLLGSLPARTLSRRRPGR